MSDAGEQGLSIQQSLMMTPAGSIGHDRILVTVNDPDGRETFW